jgi:hypothetical protein
LQQENQNCSLGTGQSAQWEKINSVLINKLGKKTRENQLFLKYEFGPGKMARPTYHAPTGYDPDLTITANIAEISVV